MFVFVCVDVDVAICYPSPKSDTWIIAAGGARWAPASAWGLAVVCVMRQNICQEMCVESYEHQQAGRPAVCQIYPVTRMRVCSYVYTCVS